MISFRKIRRGKNEKIKKRTPRVSGFSKSIGKGNWSEERKKKNVWMRHFDVSHGCCLT